MINPETIYCAAEETYKDEYANGEYCHNQSFIWGFQEGVEWAYKNIKQ